MSKKLLKILTLTAGILFHAFAVLFGVITVAGMIMTENSETITVLLNQKSYKVIESDDGDDTVDTQYFTSDKKSVAEMKAHTGELIREVTAGGAALLKNENGALPLAAGEVVSFFSVSSVDIVYAGNGSSGANTSGTVDLKDAAVAAGLKVNTDLWSWYVENKSVYSRGEAGNVFGKSYPINDAGWSQIGTAAKSDKAKTGGGAAVFVLARNGGEGADLDFAGGGEPGDYSNGNYLELSPKEKDVLKNLKQQKDGGVFSSITVLINSAYAVQCDFADNPEYGIDGVLWAGNFGTTGAYAVCDILAGRVSPSGRITDTFWKYNKENPVLANFGTYDYNEKISPASVARGNTDKYVVYQENIYNGYRYTETRYEDYVLGRAGAGDFDYAETVSYPFGYGISYSEFTYGDFKVRYNERLDEYNVSVKVTNTGGVSANEVVQIYLQKPYTAYDIENGIEKASVELVGFAKTPLLGANSSETLEITVPGEYLASYDGYEACTYILDGGDYYLTAARNAHDAINNVLEVKADAEQKSRMTEGGNAELVWKRTLELDRSKYSKSAATGNKIENRFENADINLYEGRGGSSVEYLSRNDWTGTLRFGTDGNGAVAQNHVKLTATERMKEDVKLPVLGSDTTEYPVYGSTATSYGIVDMRLDEIPYDDPLWEDLLDQLTWDETVALLSSGCRKTVAIGSVTKPETIDHNGATGPVKEYNYNEANNGGLAVANNDPDKKSLPNIYPCNGLVAATFDAELIERFGKAVGEDCLWAGYNALYGTGINIHRSAYGGRAFEYYSEDPVLTGKIAAAEVRGIQSYGVYCYMKHCVLNDIEENREGLCVWANEQTIREVYLRPFEIAIREGGAYNVMTGFNRLGLEWTGEQGFCNDVLRGEFGMRGFAVTDWYDERTWYMTSYGGILGGNDLPDGQYKESSANNLNNYKTGHGELAWAMRESAHRILYTVAHSNAMNGYRSGMKIVRITPQWVKDLNAGTVAATVAFALSAVFLAAMAALNVYYALPEESPVRVKLGGLLAKRNNKKE